MSRPPCADLAELRSAFVDGALSDADRDRLLVHLAGCASCRHDVDDLRAVRELVGRSTELPHRAPEDLSQRLMSIAGCDSDAPLWSRPFRRTTAGILPSRRRTARVRATVAGVAVSAAVAMVGVTGYAAAPADLATIADPAGEAEIEFSAAVGQFPLTSDSRSTVMTADPASLSATPSALVAGPSAATGEPITASDAQELLHRASIAGDSVSYSGEQTFVAYGRTKTFTARMQVYNEPGQGSEVNVTTVDGRPVTSGFLPSSTTSRLTDTDLIRLLERNYALSGTRGASVAGRSATLVRAIRNDLVASEWWIDEANGIVLWQRTYDSAGALQLDSGFTSVTLTSRPELIRHTSPQFLAPTTNVASRSPTPTPWPRPAGRAGASWRGSRWSSCAPTGSTTPARSTWSTATA